MLPDPKAGWDVRHVPVMEVTHHCGGQTPQRVAEQRHSRMLFARKHFGPLRAAAIRGALGLKHDVRPPSSRFRPR